MLRKEALAYAKRHALSNDPPRFLSLVRRLRLAIYIKRISYLSLGSPAWHREQERLARGSAFGFDAVKRTIFYKNTLKDCASELYVMPGTVFSYPDNVIIGYNVFINRNVYIVAQAPIIIGDNVMIGPNCVINSGSHNYSNCDLIIRSQGHKLAPIRIENDVWLGANVFVAPGVTIGEGSVVAANAAVTKDVEPYTVVGGVPARRIGSRS